MTKTTSDKLTVYKQIYCVYKITSSDDVFEKAVQLYKSGVLVDTVLPNTKTVSGYCNEQALEKSKTVENVQILDAETII